MQNMLSGASSDPHFTQEDDLVSFSFLGFLVFLADFLVFLAAFFAPQLMQNVSSAAILDPHFTQEDDLIVFLVAFLGLEDFFFVISPTSPSSVIVKPSAPAFIPDLLRYCLSYSSSSCWRDFLPVPACT